MPDFVVLDVAERIATITLARPPMNALNLQMQREIREIADEVSERDDVGAVVLHGGQKVFAAGADIKEMAGMTQADMEREAAGLHACFDAVAAIRQPTIAAITGYALGGGCELALCCDLRIAADDARLGQPEILLGIIPGGGGTQRLPRLVGPSRAKDLIFSGRFVDAAQALAMGLVDRVVPAVDVLADALAWAGEFARGPAIALAEAKRVIDAGLDRPLIAGLALEQQAFAGLFGTQDREIGMASFVAEGPGKARFVGR